MVAPVVYIAGRALASKAARRAAKKAGKAALKFAKQQWKKKKDKTNLNRLKKAQEAERRRKAGPTIRMLRSHGVKPGGTTVGKGEGLTRKVPSKMYPNFPTQYIDKRTGNIVVKDISKKSGKARVPHKWNYKKLKEFLGYKKGGFVSNKPKSAGLAKRGWGAVSR